MEPAFSLPSLRGNCPDAMLDEVCQNLSVKMGNEIQRRSTDDGELNSVNNGNATSGERGPGEKIHFVSGKLAESALREIVAPLAAEVGFAYSIQVMPITVAALMTTEWIAKRIQPPADTSRIIIPGYCNGDLSAIAEPTGIATQRGPRDLRGLPEFFGAAGGNREGYGEYSIEIIAEINHAPRLGTAEILATAQRWKSQGADLIDVGCLPGATWSGVADCVRRLKDAGHRVSIDSLNPVEIAAAASAGAELVLSVNSSNREAAADWGIEVVVIPDDPKSLAGFDNTIEFLAHRNVEMRLDPILEPIGFGFAHSLGRYLETRRRYPDARMMMGIGNLTELTECDSAGINTLLIGFCQELSIHSVLTTEVIPWAHGSVRECHAARQLMHFANKNGIPPKHLDSALVMLRDEKVYQQGRATLQKLASEIKDNNFRTFAEDGLLHLVSRQLHLSDRDAFLLFQQLIDQRPEAVDPSHAFYLGYELAKAATALTLGKQYTQDEALDWGLLTEPEESHRLRRSARARGHGEDTADN